MAVPYEPIRAVSVNDGVGFPAMTRYPEGASKTFEMGVPLVLSSGYLQEAAFGGAETIFGVSSEKAHNLAVAGTPTELSEATPPNQPDAKITPVGAWMRDGNIGIYKADGRTIFSIMLKDGQVFTQALIAAGTLYGLVKDGTSGFWYLDNTDTSGDNAVAQIVGVDPASPNTVLGGARVFFQFAAAKRYFS